jgi:23S rRNA (cytosine1962-C5)-methyltransferase
MEDKIDAGRSPRILNLFAYTGGASMACARAGAKVTHVDAAKSVNNWAIGNANLSAIPSEGIRYLADDAVKFVKRELRRNKQYDGILLDPPTFGRGTKGEVWKIERDLHVLLELCRSLLSSNPLFVLLTSHSPGVTPSVLSTMLSSFGSGIECGEMLLQGEGRPLPSGAYARWTP